MSNYPEARLKGTRAIRILLWAGLVVAVICLSLLVFLVAERVRGEHALKQRLTELKRQGEVLEISPLKPVPIEATSNAFAGLVFLTNRTHAIQTNDNHPPTLEYAAPGRALITWRQPQWKAGKQTNYWAQFAPEVREADEMIAAIRSAAARPEFSTGFDYDKGFLDFEIGPIFVIKEAVRTLSSAALLDLHENRLPAAHSNLCAAIRISVMQEPEPLVISQLVRLACYAIAWNVTWQALQAEGWSDEQLAEWQGLWSEAAFSKDMEGALVMERNMTVQQYGQMRDAATLRKALNEREKYSEITGELPTSGLLLHRLHAPVWRFAWLAQDELRAVNRWQVIIDRHRFARTNSWADLASGDSPTEESYFAFMEQAGAEDMPWYDRLRYLFSSDTFSITDAMIRRSLFTDASQQMLLTAIGIHRYRLGTGTVPADLEALVSKYLPEVPRDPMDGKPLRYRRLSDTEFLLYSVGENGVDDGGDPKPPEEKGSYRQIRDGKDAVWPAVAE